RGAAIAINNAKGKTIAKGIVSYQAAEIEQIKGLQTADVTARLGYPARSAVIHRDNMILVEGED
ncbi:MAG: glutamate 5-kinase, partial [Ponticaulis sp.]|nr:glutamate 5-kinase [Ponticaulis sp.]